MLKFRPWRPIHATFDRDAVRAWMRDVSRTAKKIFIEGSNASKGGRVYRKRGGRIHRASAPGDWPARDTGRLLGSIKTRTGPMEAEIGTSAVSDRGFPYPIVLRKGSRKRNIARRKMSDNALREAMPIARGRMKSFARFRRG